MKDTSSKVTKPYTRFYLTMLILSSIGTSAGLANLTSIQATLALMETSAPYVACLLISMLTWAISVVALVLLWRKHPLGIQLKVSAYVVNILATIGMIITAAPIVDLLTSKVPPELTANSQLTEAAAANILEAGFYLSLCFSIIANVAFALLWLRAWRGQQRADTILQ